MSYEKCLVEVDEVLSRLSADELAKIPEDVRNNIKEKKAKDYTWAYNDSKELNEQNLSRDAIAMLSYLNMEYLLSDEQRELMEEIHRENEKKRNAHAYQKSFRAKVEKDAEKKTVKRVEKSLMEVEKEKWYERLFAVIQRFFRRSGEEK